MSSPAPASTGLNGTEFPPPAPSRSPQLLRRLQVLVALALVLTGALAAWMISDLGDDLAGAPNLTQQYARLGQVRHALTAAADDAALGSIAGEPADGKQAGASRDQVSTAAGLLVDAAKARPQDAQALTELSQGVVRYAQVLATAAGLPRAKAVPVLATADTRLTTLLDQITALQTGLGEQAKVRPASLNGALAWWPAIALLALVVWASWLVARLSHRAVNPGLAGAGLAVILVLAVALGAQATAADAAQVSREQQFSHVVNQTRAVDGVDTVQHLLTFAVLRHAWDDAAERACQDAYTSARQAATTEKLPSLKAVDQARTALLQQVRSGAWADATTAILATDGDTLINTAYDFRSATAARIDTAVETATSSPEGQRNLLAVELALAVVLALAGAAAGILGLGQRLREYR